MAKRVKSGDVIGNLKWDTYLSTCVFEEDNWNPCVAWVVGRRPEDFKHIEALNIVVQTGTRRLFTVITKEQLFLDVYEFGSSKNKKSKDSVPNSEICDACKPYLEASEPIPTPLLAKLIKWKMMTLKDADIKRRSTDAKSAVDKKKGKDQKDAGKERGRSPKKGGKKSPEQQQTKEGSKLRKRGEDDDENKFIDDEPDDGAHYYILVTGFHDPYLFEFLEMININVSCIIAVSSQEYSFLNKPSFDVESPDDNKKEEVKNELKVFWKELLPLLQRPPDISVLHDIARLDYEVSSLILPADPHDTEQRVHYSTAIFDDIASMLYNLLDARRLFLTYLTNLKLIQIPSIGEHKVADSGLSVQKISPPTKAAFDPSQTFVDMKYYNDLLNTIPLESVTVPLIMHCMLEQVVATEEGLDVPSEKMVPAKMDGINFELSVYLGQVATKLGLSSQEHAMLSDVLDLPSPVQIKSNIPELININDKIRKRTHHLKPHYGFDTGAIEKTMLQYLYVAKLCHMQQYPTLTELRQRAIRLQELNYYCSSAELSLSEMDHAFKQFVFECMDLTKCDRNGFPLERVKEGLHQQHIPWDDPYPYYRIMIPVAEKNTLDNLIASLTSLKENRDEKSEDVSKHMASENSGTVVHKSKQPKSVSDVIMEMLVTLDDDACSPKSERIATKKERDAERISVSNVDMKKGILVASTVSHNTLVQSPRHSISTSVRFDVPSVLQDLDTFSDEILNCPSKSTHESLMEFTDARQRNLTCWCFAEHFKPHILLQILHDAMYYLPFVETYQHKRDQSVMLVLHNPYNRERQNNLSWHKELHSNTGFRNYLENTVESIQVWLKKKEAEYQAELLSKEVAAIHKEEDDKMKAVEKTDKKGRKSPEKSSKSRVSASNSLERLSTTSVNPYIRQGSLKAWRAEQMKLAAEEEEKDKLRLERRTRSAQKLREKQDKEKEKLAKQTGAGPKSSSQKDDIEATHSQSVNSQIDYAKTEPETENLEPLFAFYGYDTGNNLIHIIGTTSTMFPSDGGIIKTERTEMIQGTVSIRSVVQKDGHVFTVHLLNPREDMNLPEDYVLELEERHQNKQNSATFPDKSEVEKFEKEEPESDDDSFTRERKLKGVNEHATVKVKATSRPVSQFGSITAQLSGGMMLALSQFGPTGESYLKPYEPPIYSEPVATETLLLAATPTRSKTNISKAKGMPSSEMEKEKTAPPEPSVDSLEVDKEQTKEVPKQNFQELFVTCPDGLTVKYFLQSSAGVVPSSDDDRHLVVRQSYPFKTKGVQSCESVRNKYIQTEVSRMITDDGSVIKNMLDGSVEVLSADGTVSVYTGTWPDSSNHPDHAVAQAVQSPDISKRGKSGSKNSKTKVVHQEERKPSASDANWIITYPGGERIQIFKESGTILELASLPLCFASDPETKQTMATRDDHIIIVNHPNGTTIVQHADGTRISTYYRDIAVAEKFSDSSSEGSSMLTVKFVKVECPGFATVEFNTATSENLTVFGDKTSINVFPDGYYMLHHIKGGRVEIDIEGTMTYFTCRNSFVDNLIPEREQQYVMCHNAENIVETVDPHENIFNVRSNGESVVTPTIGEDVFSSKSHHIMLEDFTNSAYFDNHAPRFFIIHDDGSGTELLRYEDISEYLSSAELNPAAAVLKEPLPGHPGVTCITVLKPYLLGISEKWLKNYDQEFIVPVGLRCRDLKSLPPNEYKKPGPTFGTNVGKGLNIGTVRKGPVKIPILKCPEKLEFRQLLQYKPISEEHRKSLQNGLRDYADAVVSRMQTGDLVAPDDPRSKDEKALARDLRTLAQSQRLKIKELEPGNLKMLYENAVAPPPVQPHTKIKPKRTASDWEQDKKEKEEVAESKWIVKNKIIAPYFESELGKTFFQIKDMHGEEGVETPRVEGNRSSHAWNSEYMQNVPYMTVKDTYRSLTSSHLTSITPISFELSKKKMSTKPGTKADKLAAIKKKIRQTEAQKKHLEAQELLKNPSDLLEVMDESDKIRQRKVKTNVESIRLKKLKGIMLNPPFVDFGTIKEGSMYSYTVVLTNTGLNACRFRFRQPPPATGLRINYIAGSVAAGMSVDLNLELYAIASEMDETSRISRLSHIVEIITETDFIELLIVANILTAADYDNLNMSPELKRHTSAQMLSKRPHTTIRQFLANKATSL